MNITPAMAQYYELKEQNKDCVLFFRMWDFYEMFDEDAEIAHKVLWIAITSRNKNAEKATPLAWIPFHAKEKYLPLLVNAWYKVAFAEQVSDPKLKWIVKREVVRVVTPATLDLEWENFDSNQISNYILSITENKWIFGISLLDLSTNNWICSEFNNIEDLTKELYKYWPKEVVIDDNLYTNELLKDTLEKKYSLSVYFFKAIYKPYKKLTEHFLVKNLEWFWIEKNTQAQAAAALLLEYLEANQKSKLDFLQKLSLIENDWFMSLDESTIKSLDLLYNFSTKSSTIWTLFWLLNKTKTPMGASFLKEQIIKPLNNLDEINNRLDFIEEFKNNKILLDKARKELSWVSNINSILNRLALNRANPRDLLNLKSSLQSILNVFELIEKEGSDKLKEIIKT